ncbi:MAG: GNAT family N-acetyltransferase [Hyphomicrobiales bacterium]
MRIETLTPGNGLEDRIGDIARLRIQVFRDWPYLYDGDLDYEHGYLSTFARSPGAVCIAAIDGDRVVGASTGLPVGDEHEPIRAPLREAGFDLARVFYLAESVLLPDYRGRGVYRAFFTGREAHARTLGGFDWTVFCGVERPADHPMRPAGVQPLDSVWRHFGYTHRPDIVCHFAWKDLGEARETRKPMSFWTRPLGDISDGG